MVGKVHTWGIFFSYVFHQIADPLYTTCSISHFWIYVFGDKPRISLISKKKILLHTRCSTLCLGQFSVQLINCFSKTNSIAYLFPTIPLPALSDMFFEKYMLTGPTTSSFSSLVSHTTPTHPRYLPGLIPINFGSFDCLNSAICY